MGIFSWIRKKKPAPAAPEADAAREDPPEETTEQTPEDARWLRADAMETPERADETDEAEAVYDTREDEVFEADEILAAEPNPRLDDMDMEGFWHDTRESQRRHISPEADYRRIREVEENLGCKLPASYVELMKKHNGGLVNRCWFPLTVNPKSYTDYIQITDILGIGFDAPYSLCGRFGSRFLMDSWKHDANIGVAICNTVKPGRALVFLDYRKCGVNGEPQVVYADSDDGAERLLARNFECFVRGLRQSGAAYAGEERQGGA